MGVVDLELFSSVGHKDDQQFRRFGRAGVFGGQMVGTGLLRPVLALVVHVGGLAFELAAHRTFEYVGIDESVAVTVRHRTGGRREGHDRRGEGLARRVGKRLFEEWRQRFGRVVQRSRTEAWSPQAATPVALQQATADHRRGDRGASAGRPAIRVSIMDRSPSWSPATWMIVLPGVHRTAPEMVTETTYPSHRDLRGSARPGRAEHALDGGDALVVGHEVLDNVGVHGSVGRLRAVLEPVEVGLEELVLEIAPRVNGEDFVHLVGVQPVKAETDHVGHHAEVRGGDLRAHPARNSRGGVQRDSRPHGVGGCGGETAFEQELAPVVSPVDLEPLFLRRKKASPGRCRGTWRPGRASSGSGFTPSRRAWIWPKRKTLREWW